MYMSYRINIYISDDMHTWITKKAKDRGGTMSGLIRVILAEWLDEQGAVGDWEVESPGGPRRPIADTPD